MNEDNENFACIFEGGPLNGQILWLRGGQTHFRVWPETNSSIPSSTSDNASIPIENLNFRLIVYAVVRVGNHPSGCKYKGVLK